MKKAVLLLTVVFSTLAATAQQKNDVTIGNGVITNDIRQVAEFNKLNIVGPFEVRLVTGEAGSIVVMAEKNLISLITTEVNDNELTIAPQQGKLFKSSTGNKIVVKVPYNTLNEIALRGSGSLTTKKNLTDDLKISLTGSGKIDLDIANTSAEAVVTGSGEISLNGKTDTFICNVTGSSSVKAQRLQSTAVNVTVNGTGNADVYSHKEIVGRIVGSGNVAYTGQPAQKDLKRTGSGDFRSY